MRHNKKSHRTRALINKTKKIENHTITEKKKLCIRNLKYLSNNILLKIIQ